MVRIGWWAIALLALHALMPLHASAQVSSTRSPEQIRASYEAHRGDFDYLLGDWKFTAVSREYGEYGGLWSAVRLAGSEILDEFRVVDEGGETLYMTTTIRAYNAVQDQWELIGMDEGNGLRDFGTARRVGAEMHLEQTFGATSANPFTMRIRYYDIRPDRFSWVAERSTDGGRTWEPDHLRIQAQRIGPARTLGPLAPAVR